MKQRAISKEGPIRVQAMCCVRGMTTGVPEGKADLVLADPPYNIRVNGGSEWDTRSVHDHMQFSREWLAAAMRTLRPGGALLVWDSPNNDLLARITLLLVDTLGARFVQEMVWTYTQGGDGRLGSMRCYATRHERVLWFEKTGGARFFDPRAIATPYTEVERVVARAKGRGRLKEDSLTIGKPPWSWWTSPRVNSRSAERRHGAHPCMKPVKVCQRLLRAHAPSGGHVVIPFAGSGSETLACALLGYECDAFEIEPTYVDIIEKRLRDVV